MLFKKSYKLGWDLEKIEDLEVQSLKYYGFTKDEIKNIKIESSKDGWYYYIFEADEKIINVDNGSIKLDYKNKKVIINNKSLKVEDGTNFVIKSMKTKIKTNTMQELTNLLTGGDYTNTIANKLYSIYA